MSSYESTNFAIHNLLHLELEFMSLNDHNFENTLSVANTFYLDKIALQ